MAATLVLVPGLGGSGPEHWQTHWQRRLPGALRVEQGDWDAPEPGAWIASLEATVRSAPGPVVLVAHSLGCPLVGHWARAGSAGRVAGAFLVATADVDSVDRAPPEARGFAPMPLDPLPFRSVLVASATDPYCDQARARFLAGRWGARFVDAGDAGHINAASGHGPWPRGLDLLSAFLAEVGA